jgi:two-component system, sensor histidine kinase
MKRDHPSSGAGDSLDDLHRFEVRSGPDGLFLRYCRGRIAGFATRQILTVVGAVALAALEGPLPGFLALVLGLAGDAADCQVLRLILRRADVGGAGPGLRRLAVASATVQGASIAACVALAWLGSQDPAARTFATAFLIGAAINAGLIRPYHRASADARLSVLGLSWAALAVQDLLRHPDWGQSYFLLGSLILAYMSFSFLGYVERSFARTTAIEHDLLRQTHALRLSGEALAAREAQARRLAAVAEHANDSVILCTPDGRIDWVNDTFTRLTGYPRDAVLGRTPSEVLNSPESDPDTIATIEAARRDCRPCRVEICNRTRDGQLIWMETSITPLMNADGTHALTINVERDITETRQRNRDLAEARTRAEAAAEAKARFLATMSHEIRTPMTGVIGMAELLGDTALDAVQQSYVATIIDSGQALLTLINDILDLSRLQAGRMPIEQRPFDLATVIAGVVMLLGPLARDRGLVLRGPMGGTLPVLGDPGRVRQILVNLVGNAIKFTNVGEVTVALHSHPDGDKLRLAIEVTDTGIGIAPDRLEAVFDSFTQADGSIGRDYGGTGLGLTVSRLMAVEMAGDVTVRSRLGEGSTFTLHLTCRSAPIAVSSDPEATSSRTAGPALRGLAVLLAEDNRTNRLILRRMLESEGALVHEAQNGVEALALWQARRPDLAVMDMQMPQMDGVTAIRELRRRETAEGSARTPVIVLTANAFDDERRSCLEAGADDVLSKPAARPALVAAVKRCLPARPTRAVPPRAQGRTDKQAATRSR